MTTFNVTAIFDEYTRSPNPRMTPAQAEAAVNIVTLANTLAGDDNDTFGAELVRNARARLNTNPDDIVGVFVQDVALRLSSERQDRKYLRP
jgi:hypothetical protein